ncbi:MAG: DNA-binding protein WhiA [Clostridia bacterium]|nr:DNA-binding protein WhiA [Clostridia bacterium]
MNFTSDVKKEMINHGVKDGGARLSEMSAFLRTCGTFGVKDGQLTFFLVSETENVAEYFMSQFSKIFDAELFVTHATRDRMSGRDKLLLQCPPAVAAEVLKTLRLVGKNGELRKGISASLVSDEAKEIAYIRGAFLGGGSCTLPMDNGTTGYHLEIVFNDKKTAKDFCLVLSEFEILAKLAERKETFVAYIKSKEQISDFLAVVGAHNALKKLSELVERRDEANRTNRARNCMSGNADKAAIAAVKQVVALKKLEESGGFTLLSEELKQLAKARLDNPSMSLQELADKLCVSKSCLNHRMRKLMSMAALKEENNE